MKKIKKQILDAIDYLEQNPTISITEASQIFHIERHTVATYRNKEFNKNNLFKSQKPNEEEFVYFFSDEELACIEYYTNHSEKSYKLTQDAYPNVAPNIRTMRNWMDILGKDYVTGALKKYHYDRTKFATIDTEEDAYWLGFFTADGCIIENKHIQLKLASKDYNHLVKFAKYLNMPDDEITEIIKDEFGGAYTRDNLVNTIKICSKDIITNLENKEIYPRKSGKEKPYKCSTIQLEKAYIRGLIDGDGSIGKNNRFSLVGSKEICEYVQNFINTNIIDISNNHIHKKGNIIWTIELQNQEKVPIIIQALYKDANIYLDRKYEIYKNYYCRE